jgi:hypothetical protein
VDQVRGEQHDVELAIQVQVLDARADCLGGAGADADMGKHLRRLVYRHHRMPQLDQWAGQAADTAAKLALA